MIKSKGVKMSKKRSNAQGVKFILLSLAAAASLNAQTQNVTLDAAIVTATGFESALKEETRNIFVVTKGTSRPTATAR